MPKINFSVLMSVCHKDNPEYLNRAMQSLVEQTIRPSEIIIVKDGPLTPELDKIIEKYANAINIKTILLQINVGLGLALKEGLAHCSHEIVARMDNDDICAPNRFEKQLAFLQSHPEIDVVGTWISEFDKDEQNIYAYRKLPIEPNRILSFAKNRSPLNHMTVMFKKQAVLDAGNYSSIRLSQDYHLWVRMIMKGSKFANIPEYLVNVRAGMDMIERRGGIKYFLNELKMQREFLKLGFLNKSEFIINIIVRFGLRIVPNKLRNFIYLKIFR